MKFTLKNASFLSIFLTLFFACTEEKRGGSDSHVLRGITYNPTKVDTIHIELDSILANRNKQDFIAENIEIIPLETKEECKFDYIDKVFFDGERFYVFDYLNTKKLFVFDRNGKFLYEAGREGNRLGGFTSIVNFMVYPDRERLEVLTDRRKIVCFHSKTGAFIEEKHHKSMVYPRGMAYVDSTHLALYNNYFLGSEILAYFPIALQELRYNLLVFESDRSTIDRRAYGYDGIGYSKGQTLAPYGVFTGFYYYQDTLTFAPPFENIISRVTPRGILARYFVDFGKNAIPEEFWIGKDHQKAYKEFDKNNYLYMVERVLETSDFISLFVFHGQHRAYRILYSKKHKKIVYGFNSQKEEIPFGELLSVRQDTIISFRASEWSTSDKEKLAKGELDITEKNSHYIQYLHEVKSGDNPAIFLNNIRFLE